MSDEKHAERPRRDEQKEGHPKKGRRDEHAAREEHGERDEAAAEGKPKKASHPRRKGRWDETDEAGWESFPASDPPAY